MEKVEGIDTESTEIVVTKDISVDDIERVDFDNPVTILSYGSKLLDEMGNIMQSISKMFENDEEKLGSNADVNEKIRSLGNFSTALEIVDKATTTKSSTKGISKIVTSVIEKIASGKKKEEATPTYHSEYERYCAKVDDVANLIVNQKNSTLIDIEISNAFISKFSPYIKKLELVIEMGLKDRDDFLETVVEPLRIEAEASNDSLIIKQYSIAKQKLELFEDKLSRLQETLITSKNTVAESQIRQAPDMQLVMMYESYIQNTVPALKIQAASMVGTKRQESKIAKQQLLVQVTNEAFKKNSEQIKSNIVEVNKLAAEGNIRVATLEELKNNIGEAVKLVEEGFIQRTEARRKNMELLQEINDSFNEYKNSIDEIIASDIFGIEQLTESTTANDGQIESMGSYTKRAKK